jgi:hypothetical protein
MNTKAVSTLAASVFLCVSALVSGNLQAQQGKAEGGPGAHPPKAQGRGNVAPSPQRPEPQVPDGEAQAERDEAPGQQQGCPDQGRPLELIV